jgi:hypothetical protein
MRAQIAANSARFALNREIPVCAGLRGGAERTRTACQPTQSLSNRSLARSKSASVNLPENPPVVPGNDIRTDSCDEAESANDPTRCAILNLLGTFVGNLFKSRRQLEIENLFLGHQLKDSPEACTTSPAAPWL